jgi:hypothetical protein
MTREVEPEQAFLPDRGGTILALGILSLPAVVLWMPLGIIPWRMASLDLRAMELGIVDPAGRRWTQAGRVFAIVSTMLVAPLIAILLVALLTGLYQFLAS